MREELTLSRSIRAGASTGRAFGALSAAMFMKRSSACSLSVPELSWAPCLLCAARKSCRRLRGPTSDSDSDDESSDELAMGGAGRAARAVLAVLCRALAGGFG